MATTILTRVLISDRDNFLKAADIIFDERIREIRPQSTRPVPWNDISEPANWRTYIADLPRNPNADGARVIDADGLFLMPGAIDPHVHFNTPGFEQRDDFEHGSLAAAFGGVTTVIDMPCTSVPPVTTKENFEAKKTALKGRSCVDYAFWGGISGSSFEHVEHHIPDLVRQGVVGFKAYLISGMPEFTALSLSQMLMAAGTIEKTGVPLAVHAEDRDLVAARQEGFSKGKKNDWQSYCRARDVLAEAVAVAQMREICRETGCRIHIVHLSSKRGLNLVREARKEHLALTAETCPHYLMFTREDFERPDIATFLKTAPPVKAAIDREALWQGLGDDSLVFVTTDHAGCDPLKEKTAADFWQVYSGIPGVEHRVPFLLSEGFKKGRLTLGQIISHLSGNAAAYFGLSAHKGSLKHDRDADLVLISLWEDQTITAATMHSKGKYTPFEGMTFSAAVKGTWLRGRQLIRDGKASDIDYSYGKWIGPG